MQLTNAGADLIEQITGGESPTVAPQTNGFGVGSEVGSYLLEVESGGKRFIEQRLKLGFLLLATTCTSANS